MKVLVNFIKMMIQPQSASLSFTIIKIHNQSFSKVINVKMEKIGYCKVLINNISNTKIANYCNKCKKIILNF